MNSIKKIIAVVVLWSSPFFVHAADVRVEISTQDSGIYEISVFVDTKDSINAVEGTMLFPEFISLDRVYEGNSRILFWIEKPRIEGNAVVFGGVTPGGFVGDDNFLFKVVARQKEIGVGEIYFKDVVFIENGPDGTLVPIQSKKVFIGGDVLALSESAEGIFDVLSPETFNPEIGQNIELFDGKWFVAFSTTDKDSGISEYYIKESRSRIFAFLKSWTLAESPYVLSDQGRGSFVFVKAVDHNSNERVAYAYPDVSWYENSDTWIIIGGVLVLFYFVWKRKKRHM